MSKFHVTIFESATSIANDQRLVDSPEMAGLPDVPIPHRANMMVFCDETGMHGGSHYGFGTLWLPFEKVAELNAAFAELRIKHRLGDELKWTTLSKRNATFAADVIEWFFRNSWVRFHALLVPRQDVDMTFHEDKDDGERKHLSMLLSRKIRNEARNDNQVFRVRVDPLPWGYANEVDVVHHIVNAELGRERKLVHDVVALDSKATPAIQLVDILLGAVAAAWEGKATAPHKLETQKAIAAHLGWPSLAHDTYPSERKFNVWYFHDRTRRPKRVATTRGVRLRYR